MITNGWPTAKLQDICAHITDGKHGDCQNNQNSGFYFLSCKDVFNGKLNYMGARQITKSDFLDTHRRTKLAPSDILITNSGTIGRMAIAPDNDLTRRTTFQKSVAILKPVASHVEPRFLYYALHADLRRLIEFAGGTAQKNLLLRDLRAFEVSIPPLPVQRRIAGILSAYDDLIENNQRRIKILEDMARSLYREWFVNLRFPGHEKVRMLNSSLGKTPEGWEVKTVKDTFEILGGGTPSKKTSEYWDNGIINWYTPTDLTASKSMFMDGSGMQITQLGLNKSSAKLFPPFSVMMTSRATLGVLSINTTEASTNQGFITCIPNQSFPLYTLYHWLQANVDVFIGLGSGATFKEITKGVFKGINLLVPDTDLVSRFEEAVLSFGDQVLILQRKNQNLRRTRDLLLPRLLSGQLDVSKVEQEQETTA